MPIDGSQCEDFFIEIYTGYYQARGKGDGVGVQGEEAMSCMFLSYSQNL